MCVLDRESHRVAHVWWLFCRISVAVVAQTIYFVSSSYFKKEADEVTLM